MFLWNVDYNEEMKMKTKSEEEEKGQVLLRFKKK